jgi:acyl-coenzyme A thioesterase PaaI-like protein
MVIPPGFAQIEIAAPFVSAFGPVYVRREGERVWFGFLAEARHLNPRNLGHGGALATFADLQLVAVMVSGKLARVIAPTISLSLDYLAPVRPGDWVEGEVMLVKRTGRLAFTETILTVEGAPVVRSKGLFAYSETNPPLAPPPAPPAVAEAPTPEAYQPFDPGSGFGELFGPMACIADPAQPRIGFRVAARHLNLFGRCHGGALAMLADYQLVPLRLSGLIDCSGFSPTLSLQVDYLNGAHLGDWVEAECTLHRASGRYVFTQALMSNAQGPVARSTAIYALTR